MEGLTFWAMRIVLSRRICVKKDSIYRQTFSKENVCEVGFYLSKTSKCHYFVQKNNSLS